MTVQAYILIQTEVGKAAEVARTIAGLEGVALAEDVTGPYDVIVRAEARDVDDHVPVDRLALPFAARDSVGRSQPVAVARYSVWPVKGKPASFITPLCSGAVTMASTLRSRQPASRPIGSAVATNSPISRGVQPTEGWP